MPITYDLETDIRFLQGIEKANFDTVRRLLNMNLLSTEQIALASEVSVEDVKRIKNDMELDVDSPKGTTDLSDNL